MNNIPVQTNDQPASSEGCGHCMKGGLPAKKEVLTFITLFFIAVSTVLVVLLINEKRSNLTTEVMDPAEVAVEEEMVQYQMPAMMAVSEVVELPEPNLVGEMSVEEAIQNRRSRRTFSEEPVTMEELSQILWSAQGITDEETGHRTAPSAKGSYPYSLYVIVRNVEDLDEGLYLYDPENHTLGNVGLANAGDMLIEAGVQENSQTAPVVVAMAAVYAKTQEKFPDNDPVPNTLLEGGHIGENIYLQVEALGMATVVTGGFNSVAVGEAIGLDENESIVYLVPFGHVGEEVEEEH